MSTTERPTTVQLTALIVNAYKKRSLDPDAYWRLTKTIAALMTDTEGEDEYENEYSVFRAATAAAQWEPEAVGLLVTLMGRAISDK